MAYHNKELSKHMFLLPVRKTVGGDRQNPSAEEDMIIKLH